jgi:hypothetical protein
LQIQNLIMTQQLISHNHIENIRLTREFLLSLTKDLSTSQLNTIPPGFNNNIIWNIGHLVASQYGICYLRSNNILPDQKLFDEFKVGSKPERDRTDQEIKDIKELLFTSLTELKADLDAEKLNNYTPWTTRHNVNIKNIQNAIAFLPYHEGMHAGYIMALKRVIAPTG